MKISRILFFLFFVLLMSSCSLSLGGSSSVESNSTESRTYYTVEFDSLGGSEVASQRIIENNPVVRPQNPMFESHTFMGWYTSTVFSYDTLWHFDTGRVTSNMTLYAFWEEIPTNEEPTASLTYRTTTGGYEVSGVGEEERVIIPSTYNGADVVSIGASAFARKQITYVSIPDSVTSIGLNAFNNASNLREVRISENSQLTTIENNAFSGNSSLESIYLPSTLTTLGSSVFNNAGSLNSIMVAASNPHYYSTGNNLIETSTQTLIRGSNNSSIPDGVRIIANAAFRRSRIAEINIPGSVESIGSSAFADCEALKTITVDTTNNNFSSLDGILYDEAQTTLITVPEGIIGTVSLPSTLREIPSFAFDGRRNLNIVSIPSSVTNIRSFAFRGTNVTIYYEGSETKWSSVTKHSTWGGDSLDVLFETTPDGGTMDICTVYFSATGNTEGIANMISTYIGSDLYEIIAAVPYTSEDLNYRDSNSRTSRENRDTSVRPEIGSEPIDFSEYEIIYLGYPIWWGKAPKIIYTFLEQYDLSGKIIIPFATSASSSMSGSEADLHTLQPNAIWLTGHRFNPNATSSAIASWIDSLEY